MHPACFSFQSELQIGVVEVPGIVTVLLVL